MPYVSIDIESLTKDVKELFVKSGWGIEPDDSGYLAILSKGTMTFAILKFDKGQVFFDAEYSVEKSVVPASSESLQEALCAATAYFDRGAEYIFWRVTGDDYEAGCDHDDIPLGRGVLISDWRDTDASFPFHPDVDFNKLPDNAEAYIMEQMDYASEDMDDLVDILTDDTIGIDY